MQSAEATIRGAGLRVTKPRLALLAELREHPHADVETLASGVRDRLGRVSLQAVYDSVHALTEAGVLRRIDPAGSRARFEVAKGDGHHHLVCRSCGEVRDVPHVDGPTPCLTATRDHGFRIDGAEIIFWGHCPACTPATDS